MNQSQLVRSASSIGMAGAAGQVLYGAVAVFFPYPTITDSGFEVLWALANIGMVAGIVSWLALDVAQPRSAALLGGGLAILGHVIRIAVSGWLTASPKASVDMVVVGTIVLMFGGMGILGICTLRARRLVGWSRWAPLLVLAAGLVAAPFYSIDKLVHFILLGLLWGPAWLFLSYVAHEHAKADVSASLLTPDGPRPQPQTADPAHDDGRRAGSW
jgi:hypothetical protein